MLVLPLAIPADFAVWAFVLTLPLCLWTVFSDLSQMKIRNQAVGLMILAFLVAGLFTLPLSTVAWQALHLALVLVIGIALNSVGVMGAGDAKFLAAAAPFIFLGDLQFALLLLCAAMLAGFILHRAALYTPLHRLAPNWESWQRKRHYPAGLSLGTWLSVYLALGAFGKV
jgi:prepilin peptidase CpaA